MKKTLIILIITLISRLVLGQVDNILDSIKDKGCAIISLESHVTKHLVRTNSTQIDEGIIYYLNPDKIASYFNEGNYMIVNDNRMKINFGIFHGKFKLSRNKMIRSISHIYLFAVQGRCRELAEEGNFDMQVNVNQDFYTVQFTTKKKHFLGLGYHQISFFYNQIDFRIKRIELIDNSNTTEIFTLTDPLFDTSIDENKFAL